MFSKQNLSAIALTLTLIGCASQKLVQKTSEPAPPSPTAVSVPISGQTLTLAFVGDIMMGGSAAHKLKTEGADSFFTATAPLLQQADITMGNLEGPLGLKGKIWVKKKYTFLVNPSCAAGLAHAGFKLLTLANNHTMDFGTDALQSTLEALESNGLKHAGAGMNSAEARQPAWFEAKGHKVAVLAYSLTEPTEFWATKTRAGCASADGYNMKEDIQSAKNQGADIVVVCCHWGQEKHTDLRSYQPELAHLAIDAGADAVVCHHPHIWQALEVYHGKPIAYAIGNFAFGTLTSISQSGILYLTYDSKSQWTGGRIVPLNVNNYQVHFCPQPMTDIAAGKFFDYLKSLSSEADLTREGLEIHWHVPIASAIPTPGSFGPSKGSVPASN
jgi:poly-gamma-glutamate synthesis protein (capsule biosynthesis protein)